MRRTRLGVVLGLLLLAARCTVGPDYVPPVPDVPATWSRGAVAEAVSIGPEGIALAHWWRSFGDPMLDALVEEALKANLDVALARTRVRQARAAELVADAERQPSVGSQAAYTRERLSGAGLIGSFLPDPEFDLFQAGFDAAWEVDLFGGRRRAAEAAKAELEQAEEGVRDVQVALGAETARSYVTLRGAERRLAIADRNLASQERSLALTEERFHAGLAGELDVVQARALLASTRAERPRLEADRDRALHRLSVLVGKPPEALRETLAVAASIPGSQDPEALARRIPIGLPSELLRRRPDVRRAERRIAAATARVGMATADLFPKLSLTGSLGLESISTSDFLNIASRTYTLGPSLRWPIFEGGRIRAEIEAADAREEEALHAYRKAVLEALEDVENALARFARERERHEQLVAAATDGERAVTLARDLYQNGLGNFLAVLDAERTLFAAEDAVVVSDGAVAFDLVALFKALGGGWETAAETTAAPAGS